MNSKLLKVLLVSASLTGAAILNAATLPVTDTFAGEIAGDSLYLNPTTTTGGATWVKTGDDPDPVMVDRGGGDMAIRWTKGAATDAHAFEISADPNVPDVKWFKWSVEFKIVQDGASGGVPKDAIYFRAGQGPALLNADNPVAAFISRSALGIDLDTWHTMTMVVNGGLLPLTYDTTGLTDSSGTGSLGTVGGGKVDWFLDGDLVNDNGSGFFQDYSHVGIIAFDMSETPMIIDYDNFSVTELVGTPDPDITLPITDTFAGGNPGSDLYTSPLTTTGFSFWTTDDTNQKPVFVDPGDGDIAIEWTKAGGTREHAFELPPVTQGVFSADINFIQDGFDAGAAAGSQVKNAITFRVSTASNLGAGTFMPAFINRSLRGMALNTWYTVTMIFNGDVSASLDYDTTGLTDTNTVGGLGSVGPGAADIFIDGNLVVDENAGITGAFTYAGFIAFKSPTTPMIVRFDNFSVTEVPAPPAVGPVITDAVVNASNEFVIDFTGAPSTSYEVKKSIDLSTFDPLTVPLIESTDGSGTGQATVPASEMAGPRQFFRLEDTP
jgi:hypothetical protein